MNIEPIPTLIDQYRETFEGEVTKGMCWITDGTPESTVFGAIDTLTSEQAMASPAPGAKSIAAHTAHLRFALDLTATRLRGANPPADWASSFNLSDSSPAGWDALKRDLRRAYDTVLASFKRVAANRFKRCHRSTSSDSRQRSRTTPTTSEQSVRSRRSCGSEGRSCSVAWNLI